MVTTMTSSAAPGAATMDVDQRADPARLDEPVSPRGLRGLTREPSAVARWRTCLHEAGHAVAGQALSTRPVKAAVYDDNLGAAYLDFSGVPRTFEEALAVAAGPAAEELAELHAPPQATPPVALAVAYPERTGPLMAQLRESLSDTVAIARWCIGGIENQPDRWAKRPCWIHREARFFVSQHQHEIVEVAKRLFGTGLATLPVESEPVRPRASRPDANP